MDRFEEQLKQALARKEPDSGFEARVRGQLHRHGAPWLRVAAAVLVTLCAGEAWRWHEGLAAKQRVMLALRITGGTLNRLQAQVRGVQ
jgi:hypothetical protein